MVVMSFAEVVAESESDLNMHVEITGEVEPGGDLEIPVKVVVYFLNPHTAYFMAPSTYSAKLRL